MVGLGLGGQVMVAVVLVGALLVGALYKGFITTFLVIPIKYVMQNSREFTVMAR